MTCFLKKLRKLHQTSSLCTLVDNINIKLVFLIKFSHSLNLIVSSFFIDELLLSMLADLFTAGTTTTNGTLNYGILFLTLNPEIQEKCQKEIDDIVPRHLSPTMEDVEKYFNFF